MKKLIASIFLIMCLVVFAQSENNHIATGNDFYRQSKFDMAEAYYREALKVNPNSTEAKYNLANALMQQKKYDEANALYEELAKSSGSDKSFRSAAYYNSGVAYTKQKDLENSIEAYKNALRLNPDDKEARENLQKALSELKKQQSQSQNQQKQSSMDQSSADQKLKQLQQKEKEVQKRLRKDKHGEGGESKKDW